MARPDGAATRARRPPAPLFAQFSGTYTNTAERIIAEGEYVVVQCRGRVTTTSGQPYNNTYCHVFRVADGQLRELTEYCETDLVARVLSDPGGPDTRRRSS
jgi:ketosteroid isomerase-like protein